ncbi:helix-turn-helix domain-containing protein [Streptomyces sp. NPDC000983]|uniref:helix-turn-helix domain-containing protein n=1 Tax=Streptomyces sp. NPDC000983 TaxID=3154373 RepID=UPI003318A58A
MHEGPDRDAAHAELRRRLDEGRAAARLNQTQLARRAGLGRTTVSKALSPQGDVPSVDTVTALAGALRLPVDQLLELRRTAAGETGGVSVGLPGPGRPIGEWDPHELEVHPAGTGPTASGADGVRALPGYVPRGHDRVLAEAVTAAAAGRSQILVLVGDSSTGKTRACWEAVKPLAQEGWRLWHPFDPTRAEAALEDLHQVGPRTVVWLNEAQHYLGDPSFGERIAAAVHRLLTDSERGPVLVLGTLWPEYAHQYTALPEPGRADPYSRVRELLASHTLSVPGTFDAAALASAAVLAKAGDALLADTLSRARDGGRVTQDLAGAPALLDRYQDATGAVRALLEVAMDARRLGVGLRLPYPFLTDAAPGYLSEADYDRLTDDWAEQAYAQLAAPVHGQQVPLRRTTRRPAWSPPAPAPTTNTAPPPPPSAWPVFRLADYLEQHGRTTRQHLCPPASFWHAAHTHLTHPNDLNNLAEAAVNRHRLQWAHYLRQAAAHHGQTDALVRLAMVRESTGDREGAKALARRALEHGDTRAVERLAERQEEAGNWEEAETLYRHAIDGGSARALIHLAELRENAGDREEAETLYRRVAEHGGVLGLLHVITVKDEAGDRDGAETLARLTADDGHTLYQLAVSREAAGNREGATSLYQQAADHGSTNALFRLAVLRGLAGDEEGAEALARRAADRGNVDALRQLTVMREKAGDRDAAESLAHQAVGRGSTTVLVSLAEMREEAGDRESSTALYQQAADHGDTNALHHLTMMRESAGDRNGAEALVRQAANHGNTLALLQLVMVRESAGHPDAAETLARQAAEDGSTTALTRLAEAREQAGDQESATALYRKAADHGNVSAMTRLANMREQAGDHEGAESLYLQAANHGHSPDMPFPLSLLTSKRWPHGLDPDGTPTPPWQP